MKNKAIPKPSASERAKLKLEKAQANQREKRSPIQVCNEKMTAFKFHWISKK